MYGYNKFLSLLFAFANDVILETRSMFFLSFVHILQNLILTKPNVKSYASIL